MIGPDPKTQLAWMQTRRSVRTFADRPVPREVLERLLRAAITAPSSTNRQPWRFTVVTNPKQQAALAGAVRDRAEALQAIISRSHHAEDFGRYGDFFHEPLAGAAAIVVPQYRTYPDLIANLIASGGGDPSQFHTASDMQAELCSTSAAVMNLLVQAHAEGLGACWMAGPMIARPAFESLLGIKKPWQMVGAIALGWPQEPPTATPRKPLDRVVDWHE